MTATRLQTYTSAPVSDTRGLNPRSFPMALRDSVAIDYEAKLSQSAKEFLHRFHRAVYAGNFSDWGEADFPTAERRAIWRGLKKAQKDALALSAAQGLLEEYVADETQEAPMAKPGRGPVPQAANATPPPVNGHATWTTAPGTHAVPLEDLATAAATGLVQTPKGWVVVSYVIRGDRVVSRMTHGSPQLKQYATQILRFVTYKKVLEPRASVSNLDDEVDE